MKRVLAVLVFLAAIGSALADRPVTINRPLDANGRVEIEGIISGNVKVVGWDRNEVQVTGTLGADVEDLKAEGTASALTLRLVVPHRMGRVEADVELEVRVPRAAALDAAAVSADLVIEGVAGETDLATVSGRIRYTGASPRLEVETVSGTIEADTEATAERLSAETVSGSITLGAAGLAPNASVKSESVSGRITLRLPAAVDARLQMESFSGSIKSEFTGTDAVSKGRSRSVTVGSGSARVELETLSGSISVTRR